MLASDEVGLAATSPDIAIMAYSSYDPLGGTINPADYFGKQAIVWPYLKPGTYPALVVGGKVYVARMHISAWELAGKQGIKQFYGFAEIDADGTIVRLFQ